MKKWKLFATGLFLALLVCLMPKTAYAAETIPVTTVADITDVQTVTSKNYEVGNGNYENLVQFTLPKPAYVYVSAYSTVMLGNHTNLGRISHFAVYSDANCSNLVKNDRNMSVDGNSKEEKYLCLDAGNYWIYFAKKGDADDNHIQESQGQFRLSVAAQYLNVTATKNGSWARAKQIATDKTATGFLSNATRTSWFKFKVPAGTTAKLAVSLDNPLGVSNFPVNNTGVTVYKSNHKRITYFNVPDRYYETAVSEDAELSAGTYYIGITGDSSYDRWDEGKLVKNEQNNMGGITVKITTIKKAAISKLTNVKGKKAQVTYKAVTNAKGYEIQYSTDSKFQKGVKTAKANAKTTKVTISKLTKGKKYYVRVRAYRNDEDGNRINGSWSAVKSVKISK